MVDVLKRFFHCDIWDKLQAINTDCMISQLDQCSLSITHQNIRKPLIFWYFQGVEKGNIDLKLFKPLEMENFHQNTSEYIIA